ncbi:MAG: hypothetical protein Q4C47_08700, partial [Planctomycetia bacterium]|nr:hypothetical protein [Planctomycetia bacterium]
EAQRPPERFGFNVAVATTKKVAPLPVFAALWATENFRPVALPPLPPLLPYYPVIPRSRSSRS